MPSYGPWSNAQQTTYGVPVGGGGGMTWMGGGVGWQPTSVLGAQAPYADQSMGQPTAAWNGYGAARPTGGAGAAGVGGTGSAASDAALAFLNSVLSGQKLPMDAATVGAMETGAANDSAAAEAAQSDQLTRGAVAGGAATFDPSLQGRRMELTAARNATNAEARRKIAETASRTNFGAQMDAAGAMADIGMAQSERSWRDWMATLAGGSSREQGIPQGTQGQGSQGGTSGWLGFGPDPSRPQTQPNPAPSPGNTLHTNNGGYQRSSFRPPTRL